MCNRTIGGLGDRRILAVAAVIALLFLWLVPGFAQPQNSGGVYKVTMSSPGTMGVKSDCNCSTAGCTPTEGYVLARNNRGTLQSDSSLLDTDGFGVPLDLDLLTGDPGVSWTRQYDAGRGTSGFFNSCFGETHAGVPVGNCGSPGFLSIAFETPKGSTKSTVTFRWNFDCYRSQKIRGETIQEHFSMTSGPIDFPAAFAWTGADISGPVAGTFYLKRHLNATVVDQFPTGGSGLPFYFVLGITKLQ